MYYFYPLCFSPLCCPPQKKDASPENSFNKSIGYFFSASLAFWANYNFHPEVRKFLFKNPHHVFPSLIPWRAVSRTYYHNLHEAPSSLRHSHFDSIRTGPKLTRPSLDSSSTSNKILLTWISAHLSQSNLLTDEFMGIIAVIRTRSP